MSLSETPNYHDDNHHIIDNFNAVKEEVRELSLDTPKNSGITIPHIIVVTKRHPKEHILPLLSIGHTQFGENKVQEAQSKWQELKASYPVTLHLIGGLQTNKVADAVALFDVIQTVDREKLARALKKEMDKQQRHITCYIQINTGEEPQKSGILPLEAPEFIRYCQHDLKLNIEGLMCIPPKDCNNALHFTLLHKMAKQHNIPHLSMGMSDSYQQAIQSGATHIRIGTRIMGERQP